MIALINMGRIALVGWVIYSLILIFAPAIIHQAPNRIGGAVQFVVAYGLGYALDRLLGLVRRRKAASAEDAMQAGDAGNTT